MLQYATKVNSVTLGHFGRHEPLLWLALKCFPKRQNARGIDTRPTRVDDSMSRVPNCDAPQAVLVHFDTKSSAVAALGPGVKLAPIPG